MNCPDCGTPMYEMDGWEDMNQVCLNCFTRYVGEGFGAKVVHHLPLTHDEYILIATARLNFQKKANELAVTNIAWKPILEPDKSKPLYT